MKSTYWIALAIMLLTGTNVYAASPKTDSDVMKADANHDGKVSFEEYKAAHEDRLLERFKRKDVNGDGYIDLEEKQVAKVKRQVKRKADKIGEQKALREKYQEDRKIRKKHFYKY